MLSQITCFPTFFLITILVSIVAYTSKEKKDKMSQFITHDEEMSSMQNTSEHEEDERTIIQPVQPIKESRAKMNDFIICCQPIKIETTGETLVTRFHVEKSILASHSKVFSSMIDNCCTSSKLIKINCIESSEVILHFLQIIYGEPCSTVDNWNFDRCIDLIQLGQKYSAYSVVDRAFSQLWMIIDEESSKPSENAFASKYNKAGFLKLLSIWRELRKDGYKICSFDTMRNSVNRIWKEWLKRCGIHQSFQYRFLTQEEKEVSISDFISNNVCLEFSQKDILDLQRCLTLYTSSPRLENMAEILQKHFF